MVLRKWPACAFVVAALLSLMVPATPAASQQKTSPAPAPTEPPDAAQQEAAKKDLPPGPGRDTLIRLCGSCHLYSVITMQRKSADDWTDTVIEMRNRGAGGSDDELTQVVEYLVKNFGPNSPLPKIDMNTASAATIASSLSLTQKEGQAIVDYRDKNGNFKDLASLEKVPGVNEAQIDAAKDRIVF